MPELGRVLEVLRYKQYIALGIKRMESSRVMVWNGIFRVYIAYISDGNGPQCILRAIRVLLLRAKLWYQLHQQA